LYVCSDEIEKSDKFEKSADFLLKTPYCFHSPPNTYKSEEIAGTSFKQCMRRGPGRGRGRGKSWREKGARLGR